MSSLKSMFTFVSLGGTCGDDIEAYRAVYFCALGSSLHCLKTLFATNELTGVAMLGLNDNRNLC